MDSDAPVSTIMQSEFVTLEVSDTLDFAEDVMQLGRIRHMPVVERERLVGLVSQRDLLAASLSKVLDFDPGQRRTFLHSIDISDVMTKEVVTVEAATPLAEVARLMIRYKIGCVPIVDEEQHPVGLVTEVDLLRAIYGLEGKD